MIALWIAVTLASAASQAQSPAPLTGVFTYHNDISRTGLNPVEATLTPANVKSGAFRKLFDYAVDAQVYGQPLYVSNLPLQNGPAPVLFVTTENDSVYALDATGAASAPIWQRNFLADSAAADTVDVPPVPTETVATSDDVGVTDITPSIGITSTPVIDSAQSILYVVSKSKSLITGQFFVRIHALDLVTGQDRVAPVTIPSPIVLPDGTTVGFDPLIEAQRAALTLFGNKVYVPFASHGDNGDYHGMIVAFDAFSLNIVGALSTTPSGEKGGIWMSGDGLAVDPSTYRLFGSTGNGTYTASDPGAVCDNCGDSIFTMDTGLSALDSFTPHEQQSLEDGDIDLGSGGVLFLPTSLTKEFNLSLAVGCGKEGILYVMDSGNLGRYHASDDAALHEAKVATQGGGNAGCYGTPAFFRSSWATHGGSLYIHPVNEPLRRYELMAGASIAAREATKETFVFPGATPSISALGNQNGVVWELDNTNYVGQASQGPPRLLAYDANNVATKLFDSNANAANQPSSWTTDVPSVPAPTYAVKFTVPTVYDGRVCFGTSAAVSCYGLKN